MALNAQTTVGPAPRLAGEYQLVRHERCVDVTLLGKPDVELVCSMFHELEALTTSDDELLVLIDEREMDPAFISPQNLRLMMDAWRNSDGLRHHTRISVCAPSPVLYGLNRMAQAFAGSDSEGRLHVSRTEEEARAWLVATPRG